MSPRCHICGRKREVGFCNICNHRICKKCLQVYDEANVMDEIAQVDIETDPDDVDQLIILNHWVHMYELIKQNGPKLNVCKRCDDPKYVDAYTVIEYLVDKYNEDIKDVVETILMDQVSEEVFKMHQDVINKRMRFTKE